MHERARGVRVCRWLFLAAALALMGAAGCSFPQPIPSYECLTQYGRMTDQYEPMVSLVYSPAPLNLKDYRGVIIGPVKLGSTWIDSEEEAARYATYYRVCLLKELCELKTFDKVSFAEEPQEWGGSLSGVLRIDTTITRFYMGSGFLRYINYFLFFLPSGATDFQIEGRVTDAGTGKLILEFADRRRDLGNTPWGPNPRNFHHGFAMTVTAAKTATAFAAFVNTVRGGDSADEPGAGPTGGRKVALEGSK
jgi:hypothetical protein